VIKIEKKIQFSFGYENVNSIGRFHTGYTSNFDAWIHGINPNTGVCLHPSILNVNTSHKKTFISFLIWHLWRSSKGLMHLEWLIKHVPKASHLHSTVFVLHGPQKRSSLTKLDWTSCNIKSNFLIIIKKEREGKAIDENPQFEKWMSDFRCVKKTSFHTWLTYATMSETALVS